MTYEKKQEIVCLTFQPETMPIIFSIERIPNTSSWWEKVLLIGTQILSTIVIIEHTLVDFRLEVILYKKKYNKISNRTRPVLDFL